MEQLQTLIHSEPNWDAKVNDAINCLNTVNESLNQLKLSDLSQEGLVVLDDHIKIDGGYHYIQLGKYNLVTVRVAAVFVKEYEGVGFNLFQLPASLQENTSMIGRASTECDWWYNGKWSFNTQNYQKRTFKVGDPLFITKTYVANHS